MSQAFFNSGQNAGTYSSIAATTLLLCDILESLPKEIAYVWTYHRDADWTTLLYMITRYLPLPFFLASCITCLSSHNETFSPFGDQTLNQAQLAYVQYGVPWYIVLACTEILFVLRTVALYGNGSSLNSTFLLRLLIGLFLCEMTVAVGCFILFFEFGSPPTSVGMYYIDSTANGSYAYVYRVISIPRGLSYLCFAVPELAFQCILVLLVTFRIVSDRKTRVPGDNLVSIITRDGLWSYFSNLISFLVIIIQPSWLTGPSGLPNILWAFVSFSVTSTHLILNIRACAAKQFWAAENKTVFTVNTRSTFIQSVRTFFSFETNELSIPYHYSDFGHHLDEDDTVSH